MGKPRVYRNCEVGMNTQECEAPPGMSYTTRATCYQCGQPACKACSVIEKRRRICNDCKESDRAR